MIALTLFALVLGLEALAGVFLLVAFFWLMWTFP